VIRTYTSEAIVLARRNYSETDRILSVYSKDKGKIALIAKGVRRTTSKKRGSIEVFSRIKFSAAKGKSLDILTEVVSIENYPRIRNNLKKVAVAYFIMESIGRLTAEGEKNYELYRLLVQNLKSLGKTGRLKMFRERFIYDALIILGFWPKNRPLHNPDEVLEEIVEREMSTKRVGKRLIS